MVEFQKGHFIYKEILLLRIFLQFHTMGQRLSVQVGLLIKSLSASEKAHFKKSLTSKGGGKLGQVFDIVNTNAIVPEKELHRKLSEVYSNPTDALRKLQDRLLETLSQYHSHASSTQELNALLAQIEIVWKKRLFELSQKLIDRGLKIAEENNRTGYRQILLHWKWITPTWSKDEDLERLQHIRDELKEAAQAFEDETRLHFMYLSAKFFAAYQSTNSTVRQQIYDAVLNTEQIHWCNELINRLPRLTYKLCWTQAAAAYDYGDWQLAYDRCIQGAQSLGNYAELTRENNEKWLGLMGNATGLAVLLNKRQEHQKLYDELLASMAFHGINPETTRHGNLLGTRIDRMTAEGNLTGARELLQKAVNGELSLETVEHLKSLGHLTFGLIYNRFLCQEYSKALTELNEVLDRKEFSSHHPFVYALRWLELACAYHLNDETFFISKQRSFRRFLKQWDSGFEWEELIINELHKTIIEPEEQRKETFDALHKALRPHLFELRGAIKGFNMLVWIEAEAENRPMIEVVKEKYNT